MTSRTRTPNKRNCPDTIRAGDTNDGRVKDPIHGVGHHGSGTIAIGTHADNPFAAALGEDVESPFIGFTLD